MAIREKMRERAAKIWECSLDQVEYADGVISGPADAEGKARSLTFKELAGRLPRTGGTIDVGTNINRSTTGPAFAGHIVDVEVDRETGKVEVLRYTAVQDVGTAIHPSYVEGQIQGGAVMGVGQALLEEIALEEGNNLTTLFANYLIPTSLDVPDVRPIVLESGEGKGPFNARGIGEPPTGPPPAAIASAVWDAIGVRPLELPIAPERVFDALEAQRTGAGSETPEVTR